MRKIEFDETNINLDIIHQIIGDEVIAKAKKIKVNGFKNFESSAFIRWNTYNMQFEKDIELTPAQITKCRIEYNKRFKEKKAKVEGLLKKCDHIFHDLKTYIKMKSSFEGATYCSVETELQGLYKKYITNSRASSYAVYRIRNQEFNKMECV